MTNGRTIALRALNELSGLHKPTYVGLRFLLQSGCSDKRSDWLKEVPIHKMARQDGGLYFDVVRFKQFNPNNSPQLRHFIIPSPFTALAEAELLDALFRSKQFSKPSCVFSNLPPPNTSYGRNYEFYYNGYKRRNLAITDVLRGYPKCVALVGDIRNFYPSINKENILRLFGNAVSKSITGTYRLAALKNAERILYFSDKITGVPLGPGLSHVLGDLALQNVDLQMIKRYPGKYFRYVDDIVVIVPREEVDDVRLNFTGFLDQSALVPNPDKWDIVDAESWQSSHGSIPSAVDRTFDSLLLRLKTLAVGQHQVFREVMDRLREREILFPLERFYSHPPTGSFAQRIRVLFRSGVRPVIDALTMPSGDIVRLAERMRDQLEQSYLQMEQREGESSGMTRRFKLQRSRFFLNRLLYVLPRARFGAIAQILRQREPELLEQREIFNALANNNLGALLRMPGNTVVVFAMHHRRRQLEPIPIPDAIEFTQDVVSSLAILLLFGVCRPLSEAQEGRVYLSARNLFRFCSGKLNTTDQAIGQNYLSELAGLNTGKSAEDIQSALLSAFSVDEEYADEGLSLGGSVYTYL